MSNGWSGLWIARGIVAGVLLVGLLPCKANAQQALIDSLKRALATQSGADRISTAGELAYMYCYVNTDSALLYGKQELELAEQAGDSAQIAQAWSDLAAAFLSRGEFLPSLQLNRRSLAVRERLGDSLKVASTLGRMGYALLELGRLDEALTTMIRAANIYEQSNEPRYLGMMYNHIGAVHQRQGNSAKAIHYFEMAVERAEQVGDLGGTIAPLSNLGKEYFDKGEHKGSKDIFSRLVRTMDSLGIQENLALVKMNLGASYAQLEQYDSALYYYVASDSLYEAKGDRKGLAMLNVGMGICYTKQGALDKAGERLERGRRYAEETNSDWQLHLAYQALCQYEEARGNFKVALAYLQQSDAYERKVRNAEIDEKVAEMEARFKTAEKEKDLALRNKELADSELDLRNQQLIIVILASVLLAAAVAVGLLLRRQRLRRERLVQQAQMALQEERLRISRDLHDNIGSELALIASSLELHALAAPSMDVELKEVGGHARNAMSQLRETIWAIRSEAISVDALGQRLIDFAAKQCRPAGLAPDVRIGKGAEINLSPSRSLHLYRLLQEAIHNAAKYSQGKNLKVNIQVDAGVLSACIEDDGVGFDVAKVEGGYGLKNMEARSREMSGTWRLNSALGRGTRIDLEIPI